MNKEEKSMLKSLRLLLFSECNRNCDGCCNKDWDLDSLPVVNSFHGYDEIILTGGEPMLHPGFVIKTIEKIRKQSKAKIYVYTAKIDSVLDIYNVVCWADGITVTLHDTNDVKNFIELNNFLLKMWIDGFISKHTQSFRLNVFEGVDISGEDLSLWIVKSNIKWIKNCPLPENEVFMRL
jgi:hypothetical protein